jgi:hypothetical protein
MYVPTAAGDNLKLLQLLAMDYSPHQKFRSAIFLLISVSRHLLYSRSLAPVLESLVATPRFEAWVKFGLAYIET